METEHSLSGILKEKKEKKVDITIARYIVGVLFFWSGGQSAECETSWSWWSTQHFPIPGWMDTVYLF